MDIVKLIKMKCVEKGTTPRQVEQECGFSNGYLVSLRFPMVNYQRAKLISEKLDIPLPDLIGGTPEQAAGTDVDVFTVIRDKYGADSADDVKMLLELDAVNRAELRGEMRQMLRLKKYADELS